MNFDTCEGSKSAVDKIKIVRHKNTSFYTCDSYSIELK